MSVEKDSQSRKWQITINNPVDKGFTHDKLKELVSAMSSVVYWCMSDEIGENETYHTHVYLHGRGGIRFSTIKKKFDGGHFEMARGTAQENMEYVSKTGKWKNDKKSDTSVAGTFEEFGEMPVERQGRRNDIDDLYCMLREGLSDYDILEQMPESMIHLDNFDKVLQLLKYEQYKDEFRDLDVIYLSGDTGVGKTRGIMEMYGYSNVYRVTDYQHPFDNYRGQDVVIFEEFRSSFPIQDMLNYLDGYPCELPCRYNNKYACFTKAYICTNLKLEEQYKNVQHEFPSTWLAFLRRIKKVCFLKSDGSISSAVIEIGKDGFYTMWPFDFNPFTTNSIN